MSGFTFEEITKTTPEKSLLKIMNRQAGPRHRRDAPPASGPDVAILEVREQRLRDLGERRGGRTPSGCRACLRPAGRGADGERNERDARESDKVSGRTAWVHLAPRRE